MNTRRLLNLATLVTCALIAACATPTPYKPAGASGDGNGYSSRRIDSNRFRVSFQGNSLTSRQTVENYLLYRAAELTVQQKADWFVVARRGTQRKTDTYVDRPFGPGRYGYWGPTWRYQDPRFGWRTWDPYGRGPFWDQTVDVRTVNRYEASAEIIIRKGAKPASNRRAFDAREVMTNLEDAIRRPLDG
ncbi:MAG: hypothetical protein ABIT36_12735 [Steroidobacteraceae bacterium]